MAVTSIASVKVRWVPSVAAAELEPFAPPTPREALVVIQPHTGRSWGAVDELPVTGAWLESRTNSMSRASSLRLFAIWRTISLLRPALSTASWVPETMTSLREICVRRSEEHTSELQSQFHLVCRLLLEKKKINNEIE